MGYIIALEFPLKCGFTNFLSLQDSQTPLHKASAKGHEAVVEVLVNAGADHFVEDRVSIV